MIDKRANSTARLTPPPPLPHVSRRALQRVSNAIAPPTECRYCQGKVELVSNAEIYKKEYGPWPYAYLCRNCDAFVGLHPHTDIPLGTIAIRSLRDARKNAKAVFHKMMEVLDLSRDEAYALLARKIEVPVAVCHFGWFEEEHCNRAKVACLKLMRERSH